MATGCRPSWFNCIRVVVFGQEERSTPSLSAYLSACWTRNSACLWNGALLRRKSGRWCKMKSPFTGSVIRRTAAVISALLLALPFSMAQTPAEPVSRVTDAQADRAPLSPQELENLVAPIALYPDPLLGQVLAASTYPLEVVEAHQWLRQHGSLHGSQLMDAARQQNWDPSVQALVAFPDALRLLADDIRWTTDLGNAFLAQQADVMNAVQQMRARARDNGRLATTPQQVVNVNTQDGQNVVEILPADPQVIYVPVYNPYYVWGPPVWGFYPDLWYANFAWGFGFGPAIYIGGFFPGWIGWGGWGWGCGWHHHGLFLHDGFFSRYGYWGGHHSAHFGGRSVHGFGGRDAWVHNPGHRMGVPYPNRDVASRFHSSQFGPDRFGSRRFAGDRPAGRRFADNARIGGSRWSGGRLDSGRTGSSALDRRSPAGSAMMPRSTAPGGWRRFSGDNRSAFAGRSDARGFAQSRDYGSRSVNRGYGGSYRQSSPNSADGGVSRSYRAPSESYRGYNSSRGYQSSPSFGRSPSYSYSAPRGGGFSAPRSYSAPSHSYSAPRGGGFSAPRSYSAPSRGFSAPRSFGGGSGFSGGRSGGGNSGFSGGHSGGGGGRRRR